ncbi:hypothetical protein C8Q70DRAFT_907040 [Cubamyces menziesii]|uniref:Uncharacterized protein n=1 Tax=Trametes cubensis TaxID=1111947 RepID=A0AAD7XF63_9APHY|nr:hypothetical protein C8Q70DRAFT_907040 [Cubamyces menziesii]KAJ8496470.1 hypothetical protein ONZ51_g1107 [Trametes cubensis]
MAASYGAQSSPVQNIALRLPINQSPSDTVPNDLQRYYNRDIWAARQRAVLMKGSRYLKPRFEIIFTIFMLLASFAVPITVYYVVLHALPRHEEFVTDRFGNTFTVDDQAFWQARAASLGAFLGLLLIGWGPLFLWKAHGKRQVNQMLRKFSVEDAAVAGPGAQTPQWSMKMPGIGSKAIHLIISYPRPYGPTPYAPGAQLPPYLVNPPVDPAANGWYAPYMGPGHVQGQPHHAPTENMGGVPLYNENDEKIPDYSGPTSDTYLPHEKERFEDVKV